jgi:hypothetical protein
MSGCGIEQPCEDTLCELPFYVCVGMRFVDEL